MKNKKIISEEFNENNSSSNVNENNKTKKKSNAQKAITPLIVAVVSLVVVLVCVLIAYYQVYSSGKQNANILEGVYSSSYYSMVDNVNNLSVDLAKYSTLSTNQAKRETMQDMMEDCNYILSGLSILPINEENVVSATKFFNQVNGLCESYLTQLGENRNLSVDQELMFDKIGLVVGKIKANFNEQNYGVNEAGYSFVDASIFDNSGMNELSDGMGDLTNSNIEYPSMIFDGPFSSAFENKKVVGLHGDNISIAKAYEYLKNTVYQNRDVKIDFIQETVGDISTYDFEVSVDGKRFNAQVSKKGGLLITLSGYSEPGDPIISREQAGELAKNFANNIGFENMETVWLEKVENVAYVNLAPVKQEVIYYPDLVKVKVDLTAQDVIGFEAVNYAFNHTERSVEFNAPAEIAEKLLGFDYEIIKTAKTVIRLDSGKEVAAYEFITERIDGTYFYYIDANNPQILKTMKLVNVQDVEKLI